jgi:hypothetical protein
VKKHLDVTLEEEKEENTEDLHHHVVMTDTTETEVMTEIEVTIETEDMTGTEVMTEIEVTTEETEAMKEELNIKEKEITHLTAETPTKREIIHLNHKREITHLNLKRNLIPITTKNKNVYFFFCGKSISVSFNFSIFSNSSFEKSNKGGRSCPFGSFTSELRSSLKNG